MEIRNLHESNRGARVVYSTPFGPMYGVLKDWTCDVLLVDFPDARLAVPCNPEDTEFADRPSFEDAIGTETDERQSLELDIIESGAHVENY